MEKRKFIIDCDPGIDDAVALFLAAAQKDWEIVAVTSVAGNVNIDFTTQNALDLCTAAGISPTVARGAAQPMLVDTVDASYAHGTTGLGTVTLPKSELALSEKAAWDVIYEETQKAGGQMEIIALGPLTNLGILFSKYPDIKPYIKQITVMGGSRGYGNVSVYGEYNIWADPLAADIVFKSGVPLAMVGLETIFRAKLTTADWDEVLKEKSKIADIVKEIMRHKAERGEGIQDRITAKSDDPSPFLCDCMTVACVVDPDIVKCDRLHVYIETAEGPNRGRTVMDYANRGGHSRGCQVAVEVSREGFKKVMKKMMKHYAKKG